MIQDELFERAPSIGEAFRHVNVDAPFAVAAVKCREPFEFFGDVAGGLQVFHQDPAPASIGRKSLPCSGLLPAIRRLIAVRRSRRVRTLGLVSQSPYHPKKGSDGDHSVTFRWLDEKCEVLPASWGSAGRLSHNTHTASRAAHSATLSEAVAART